MRDDREYAILGCWTVRRSRRHRNLRCRCRVPSRVAVVVAGGPSVWAVSARESWSAWTDDLNA